MKISVINIFLILFSGLLFPWQLTAQDVEFIGPELLGRPTDHSITVNVVADAELDAYFKYGTSSGIYSGQTSTNTYPANEPVEVVISGLQANTRYYYRMVYSADGGSTWIERDEHSFHTQRAQGSSFRFTIIADSHMSGGGGNVALYEQALANASNDNADFHFDLGDTFWTDGAGDVATVNQRFLAQRQWMGVLSHSSPVFVAPGNHENEEGWNFDDFNSIALRSVNARKRYYPNPVPDEFYKGNNDALPEIEGDHLREDYFAWEWGDALFVFIDPFQYTMTKPYSGTAGGEVNDESPIGDRWDWTLGYDQFIWLKQILEESDAKYKFVFAHHIVGGSYDYVREAAEVADLFEWGGYNADVNNNPTTWGFSAERPGWGDNPIHQTFVANGVSAFFYGHDHEYAYQKRDGVVYQLVPSPSMSGYGFNLYSEDDEYTERVLPNAGHLRVTVTPTESTVEYVRSNITEVSHTYTILPNAPSVTHGLTMSIDPEGTGATTPTAGVHTYNENSVVNITADPSAGYAFDHWTGDVANVNSANTTVTMDTDKAVKASFVPSKTGDINGDKSANSTDALIVLLCDAGIDISQFCPCNCGDVNGDGVINSTDALIILLYDAGMSVSYPVGEGDCPSGVTPCAGCSP
jgi:hypothetical protein